MKGNGNEANLFLYLIRERISKQKFTTRACLSACMFVVRLYRNACVSVMSTGAINSFIFFKTKLIWIIVNQTEKKNVVKNMKEREKVSKHRDRRESPFSHCVTKRK